jgi:micrococcal nuclease
MLRLGPLFGVVALLCGCPRSGSMLDAGSDIEDGGVLPGNPFEGELTLDDDAVSAIDPATLPATAAACRRPLLGRVTFVSDGDTVHVSGVSELGEWQVRLIGVDTPEIAHGGSPADCFGPEAQAFTSASLDGRLVWLTFDAGCLDSFERSLAYLWIGAGAGDLWQRQLLRRGMARTLSIAPNVTMARTFEDDQQIAADDDVGLWGACP